MCASAAAFTTTLWVAQSARRKSLAYSMRIEVSRFKGDIVSAALKLYQLSLSLSLSLWESTHPRSHTHQITTHTFTAAHMKRTDVRP